MKGKIKNKKILISVILVLAVLLSYYLYYQNTALQLGVYKIESEKLPAAFDGAKIVQVSDFHNTKSAPLRESLAAEIKEQAPDIIVITGDIVDSRKTNMEISLDFVEEIKDIAPIYYVPGNHESRLEDYRVLANNLQDLGVIVLENRSESFELDGESIELVGLIDPMFAHEKTVKNEVISAKMLDEIDFDEASFSVLLAHRPELFEVYEKYGFDLMLSGHAHGGQIRLPFFGAFLVPNQGFFPEYAEGRIDGNGTMIISRGIGNSLAPFRINNRPELIVVELGSLAENK